MLTEHFGVQLTDEQGFGQYIYIYCSLDEAIRENETPLAYFFKLTLLLQYRIYIYIYQCTYIYIYISICKVISAVDSRFKDH